MNWEQLLTPIRFGLEDFHDRARDNRNQFQRDYDRLIFSSSFRRLQNKTQVFPLPGSVFVHNRLTHSLEVASVGRSLGTNISQAHQKDKPSEYMDEIGYIISAACLAHDMGNPPFGHSGEQAIATFFSEGEGLFLKNELSEEEWCDFIKFDGNANAFRLLTHQFNGKRKGGFVLTYSTLSAIVKYPYESIFSEKGKQKFGFFNAEKENYERIASRLGVDSSPFNTNHFCRSPLVYLVEAADDISYQIMDLEDAFKLKLLSEDCIKDLYMNFFDDNRKEKVSKNMRVTSDVNEQIAYLRSSVIGVLIDECSRVFLENEKDILQGSFSGPLIKRVSPRIADAYKECSRVAVNSIYKSEVVLDIELAGYKIIRTLLALFIEAVMNPTKVYSAQLLDRVPTQYDIHSKTTYGKVMAILDYISSMTDVYALDLYRKITGISTATIY